MTTFQFDQCFNDKKVIQACTNEGLALARRLPRDLLGKPDPELLAVLMAAPNPLVTLDRALPTEHSAHIPERHPGIVVVNYSHNNPRTITTAEAAKILRTFKDQVPTWHQLGLQNSIVEITEKSVEVWHKDADGIVQDRYLEFNDDGGWVVHFVKLMIENSQRQVSAT